MEFLLAEKNRFWGECLEEENEGKLRMVAGGMRTPGRAPVSGSNSGFPLGSREC